MTRKQKAIRACAMHLMYAYDDLMDVECEEEYKDAKQEYNWRLSYLSELTGIARFFLESALGKREGYTYDLDWLRNLGVDI